MSILIQSMLDVGILPIVFFTVKHQFLVPLQTNIYILQKHGKWPGVKHTKNQSTARTPRGLVNVHIVLLNGLKVKNVETKKGRANKFNTIDYYTIENISSENGGRWHPRVTDKWWTSAPTCTLESLKIFIDDSFLEFSS